MRTTGVIIGRFQIDNLHEGHLNFISEVSKKNDNLIILLGTSDGIFTSKNPLPFESRKQMILDFFPSCLILEIKDHHNDATWSKNVDDILKSYSNCILYGSRDSFIPYYSGSIPVIELPAVFETSATALRKEIGKTIVNSSDFRKGIIYTTENVYPKVYPTVDIAIINKDEVLLGRKPGQDTYCFIGGFVDPSDKSFENAAIRELKEEVKGISTMGMNYVTSCHIEDYRYKGTRDSIITTFFATKYIGGDPKAADDIEEVKWFKIKDIKLDSISKIHKDLFISLLTYLKYNKV